jgi:spore germination cell wall hydrolase CwlJ-like protein
MTLNYNLGMSEHIGDRVLVRAVSLLLVFTILFVSLFDGRRYLLENINQSMESAGDWAFARVTNYKKETWDQRLMRLMNTNIESAGGVSAAVSDREVRCLAENVYYESRGEPLRGQFAVANVTINRLNEGYAGSVCGVVKQGCQFSWVCNGVVSRPFGPAWQQAVGVALVALNDRHRIDDPTNGASHFHATYIEWQPEWRRVQNSVSQIGNHIFYRTKPRRD